MTRKQRIIGLTALGVFVLLIRPDILGVIFALVFLGMIPGTTLSLPFWLMLIVYVLGALIIVRWLAQQPMYVGNMSRQEKTARAIARKKVISKTKKKPTARKSHARVRKHA